MRPHSASGGCLTGRGEHWGPSSPNGGADRTAVRTGSSAEGGEEGGEAFGEPVVLLGPVVDLRAQP